MLTLYHHGSSACSAKVRFVLEEKQLAWNSVYIDILAGEQFRPSFLAINPKAVVPVLEHDGQVIPESTVICEYLEERFPALPLMPSTPLERARVRLWTKAVDEELHPACSALTYIVSHRHTILRNGVGSFEEFLAAGHEGRAAREMKWQWLQDGLAAPGAVDKIKLYLSYLDKMERTLAHSPWLAGAEFTLADVALAPYLNRLAALAMNEVWENGRLPRVANWFSRVQARPAFHQAVRDWVPAMLRDEMFTNGMETWPQIQTLLQALEKSTG